VTTTGVCLAIAGVVIAVLVFSAIAEAVRRMRKAARPNTPGDLPPLTHKQVDRVLQRIIRKDGEP
jgi:hypothetical protein